MRVDVVQKKRKMNIHVMKKLVPALSEKVR